MKEYRLLRVPRLRPLVLLMRSVIDENEYRALRERGTEVKMMGVVTVL